jgi:hypothetical protein
MTTTSVRIARVFLLLTASASAASATTYVAMADHDLVDQAAVIARVKVVGIEAGPASEMPATDYLVEVETLDKGSLPGSTVAVRVPGGVRADGLGLKIWGAPEFQLGEEPLLFLEPAPDGVFRILHLMLGAFHARRSGAAVLALQDLSEAHRLPRPEGNDPGDLPGVRDLASFEAWVADHARGDQRAASYWRERPAGFAEGLEKYAQIHNTDGIPVRWFTFDGGGSVAWKLDAAGQPGLDPAQSQARLQAALQAWNDDPTSTINYTFSGLIAAGSGKGLRGTDGVNAVLFDDPADANVPGTYDCKAGGVLAMGGPYFVTTSTRSYRGQAYHEIVEADTVFQNGTACFFANNPTGLEEVMAHELGHTLGFAHSADKNALMYAYAHNDSRGARLADDDRMGASVVYGDGSFKPAPPPPPPAALTLSAAPARTQAQLSWANVPEGAVELRVECQKSRTAFQLLQTVPGEMTQAMVAGLRPNQTYVLRVTAVAADGAMMGRSNTVRFRTRK